MNTSYFQVCKCHCHISKNVKHIMACCFNCSICDKNIVNVYFTSHKKACEEEKKQLLEKITKEFNESTNKDHGDNNS